MPNLREKLRAIIHGLRMETLLNVEPSKIIDVRSRILRLPKPEEILQLSEEELVPIQKRVEKLIFDLDKASETRSKRRALRNISKTGLPPSRKPLLAKKLYMQCPHCDRSYEDGKWVRLPRPHDKEDCVPLLCPACKVNVGRLKSASWYSKFSK